MRFFGSLRDSSALRVLFGILRLLLLPLLPLLPTTHHPTLYDRESSGYLGSSGFSLRMRGLGTHTATDTADTRHAPFSVTLLLWNTLCSLDQSERATAPRIRAKLNNIKKTIEFFVLSTEYSLLIGLLRISTTLTTLKFKGKKYVSILACAS